MTDTRLPRVSAPSIRISVEQYSILGPNAADPSHFAIDLESYDGEGSPMGEGQSEDEAIRSLAEQWEIRYDDDQWRRLSADVAARAESSDDPTVRFLTMLRGEV